MNDLQYIELYRDWDTNISRLLNVIQPIPPNIKRLRYSLDSDNDKVRFSTIEALGDIPHLMAVSILIGVLNDKDELIRSSAAKALGNIGALAAPKLIGILDDRDELIRSSAAKALERGSTSAVHELMIQTLSDYAVPKLVRKTLIDRDELIRSSAAKALEAAVSELTQALSDNNVWVRCEAAKALSKIGNVSAVSALIKALDDESADVRGCVAQELGNIAQYTTVNYLIAKLHDENQRRTLEHFRRNRLSYFYVYSEEYYNSDARDKVPNRVKERFEKQGMQVDKCVEYQEHIASVENAQYNSLSSGWKPIEKSQPGVEEYRRQDDNGDIWLGYAFWLGYIFGKSEIFFEVLNEPNAQSVRLAGDFNGWQGESMHLVEDDRWELRVNIGIVQILHVCFRR